MITNVVMVSGKGEGEGEGEYTDRLPRAGFRPNFTSSSGGVREELS